MVEWNAVTWYSRLAAIIVFVGILPILNFYIGMKYQETASALAESVNASQGLPICLTIHDDEQAATSTSVQS